TAAALRFGLVPTVRRAAYAPLPGGVLSQWPRCPTATYANVGSGGLSVRPSRILRSLIELPLVGGVPVAQRVAVVRAVLLVALLRRGLSALRERRRSDCHREDDGSK